MCAVSPGSLPFLDCGSKRESHKTRIALNKESPFLGELGKAGNPWGRRAKSLRWGGS